jgi:TrmH family RNA methyltransferase
LKKFRQQHGLFIVEGHKSVLEAIKNIPNSVQTVYHTEDGTSEQFLDLENIEFQKVSSKEMDAISQLKTSSSKLAIVKYFNHPNLEKSSLLTLVLDGIQDPGNLGTIIRLADWFGVSKIICSIDTVDCFNAKVVQATMGSLFRVNIQYMELDNFLSSFEGPIYGAFMDGKDMRDVKLSKESILIMGNEGQGIRSTTSKFITDKITIPGSGNAESLNVGIATGVLVSHLI